MKVLLGDDVKVCHIIIDSLPRHAPSRGEQWEARGEKLTNLKSFKYQKHESAIRSHFSSIQKESLEIVFADEWQGDVHTRARMLGRRNMDMESESIYHKNPFLAGSTDRSCFRSL